MPSLVTLGITEYDLVFRFIFTIIRSKLIEVRKFKGEVTHKNTYTSVVPFKINPRNVAGSVVLQDQKNYRSRTCVRAGECVVLHNLACVLSVLIALTKIHLIFFSDFSVSLGERYNVFIFACNRRINHFIFA